MELFKIRTGANMVHVPYRGSGPIIADVIGGQIQLTMSGKSVLLPHVQSGKMRAIAVTAGERWPELPDVGTLVEAKYMDAAYDTIFGIVAPAGTPAPVIATLNAAMNDGLKSDEVRASLAKLGIEPRASTVAEFAAIIATEAPRWAEVVRVTGIKAGRITERSEPEQRIVKSMRARSALLFAVVVEPGAASRTRRPIPQSRSSWCRRFPPAGRTTRLPASRRARCRRGSARRWWWRTSAARAAPSARGRS